MKYALLIVLLMPAFIMAAFSGAIGRLNAQDHIHKEMLKVEYRFDPTAIRPGDLHQTLSLESEGLYLLVPWRGDTPEAILSLKELGLKFPEGSRMLVGSQAQSIVALMMWNTLENQQRLLTILRDEFGRGSIVTIEAQSTYRSVYLLPGLELHERLSWQVDEKRGEFRPKLWTTLGRGPVSVSDLTGSFQARQDGLVMAAPAWVVHLVLMAVPALLIYFLRRPLIRLLPERFRPLPQPRSST